MGAEKEIFKKAVKGGFKEVLESNKAFFNVVDNVTGLPSFAKEMVGGSHNLGAAARKAGYTYANKAGKEALNYKKIAGAYIGASTAGRIATGGGLYKDRAGNTNVIGLPFI